MIYPEYRVNPENPEITGSCEETIVGVIEYPMPRIEPHATSIRPKENT